MQDLIFGLLGGTALLMYGVDKMGSSLEKASGQMMKKIITVLTGRVWSAFLVGTFLTALVQSSTAITLLTVGFVNSGLMKLSQAVGIIYGANIGTTITAQLMAVSFKFKLTDIALPVIGIGFIFGNFIKNDTIKNVGNAVMGFGMMFLGLKILNGGIPYIQNSQSLRYFFENYASIPIIGIFLGALATALVHSSSATIGLVLILAKAGLLDLNSAVCIMLGDNIGTCITAQLASLTGKINGRRTAWAHTLYNVIGVLLVSIFFNPFLYLVKAFTLNLQGSTDLGLQIANSHTLFNSVNACIFLPLTKYYVKFLETIIKDKKDKNNITHTLDKLLLDTPIAAIKASISQLSCALDITKDMFKNIKDTIIKKDDKKIEKILKDEEALNSLQKELTEYIIELSKKSLSKNYSKAIPGIINSINNIERVGDHLIDILHPIENANTKPLCFSDEAKEELNTLNNYIEEMINLTIISLKNGDKDVTQKIKDIEDNVDNLCRTIMDNHVERLKNGVCNIETGVILLDIINHLERMADHIYKVSMIATNDLSNLYADLN